MHFLNNSVIDECNLSLSRLYLSVLLGLVFHHANFALALDSILINFRLELIFDNTDLALCFDRFQVNFRVVY